jgi:sodium transport system ATP-binding protein
LIDEEELGAEQVPTDSNNRYEGDGDVLFAYGHDVYKTGPFDAVPRKGKISPRCDVLGPSGKFRIRIHCSVMVIADGLRKEFPGGNVAAADISFQARPGEVFGLLGVNGAGKTTTLRMLSTVLTPTSGRATVNGFDVTTAPHDVRRSIGFMSTSTALYGRLSGREVLEYFGRLYKVPAGTLKQRLEAVESLLNLATFWDRPCETYSTGQKQRVSIARTILHDPPILFFDEPTAGLDIVTAQTVMEFIESCRTQGKTIIFSTHIMSEVERLCDRIGVIHGGNMVALGTQAEIRKGEPLETAFLELVGYQRELAGV